MNVVSIITFVIANAIALVFAPNTYGQKSQRIIQLEKLDSIAFRSLETHSASAISDANKLLEESLTQPPSIYSVNAYTILGILNKEKGYYITSLNYFLNALTTAEVIRDQSRISACLNNIGTVYQLQQNNEKAKSYFLKSLSIEKTLKNPLQKSIRYYNLGEVYLNLNNLDLAISYFNQSLIIEKKEQNNEGIIYALLGLSGTYIKINRIPEAEFSLSTIKGKLGKYNLEERILYNKLMGDLHSKTKKFQEAFAFYQIAENLSTSSNFRIHLVDIYRSEMAVLKQLKHFEEFADKTELFVKTQDDLNNTKIKNQLEDLTFQNSIKQKELEIKLLKEEKELLSQTSQSQKQISFLESKIIWFLIATIIFIMIVLFYGIKQLVVRK